MALTRTSGVSFLTRSSSYPYFSSLLPEIVSKDGQSRPYRRRWSASGQHSTQRELALEHADRRFHPTAEPLQRPKPLLVLVPAFCCTQTTDLRDAHPLYTRLFELPHVVGAVVSSIRSQLLRLYTEALFGLPHQRKQLSAVIGIATVDLIVNDDSGTVLYQLQRAPKLHGSIELALADGSCLSIVEGNDPLWYRLLSLKLLLGLAQNSFGQLNLLQKLLPSWQVGHLSTKPLKNLAALLHGMLGELGRSFKNLSSLFFARLGVRFCRLTPSKKRPFGGTHVAGDLVVQRARRASERFDGLMKNTHVIGVTDVSFERGRVDANATRLDRAGLNQRPHQLLIQLGHSLFAESLVELDQGCGVRYRIHQRQMAEVTPRKSLAHFPLNFFVAQPPAKLQVHHPKVNPYRCTRTAQTLIENLLEGLKQFGLTEKLVDFPKLLVQFIQRGINKAVAKTELLSYGCTHALFVTHAVEMTEK